MSRIFVGLVLLSAQAALVQAAETTRPWPGLREHAPAVHAIVGATVVPRPGETLERATLVIRDGRIEAVGTNVAVPPDARVWQVPGTFIYPGLIDPYTHYGQADGSSGPRDPGGVAQAKDVRDRGAVYWNAKVRPDRRAVQEFSVDTAMAAQLRSQGITAVLTVPDGGIFSGTAAVVGTGAGDASEIWIKDDVALGVQFNAGAWDSPDYPGSLMGVFALIRQSYLDADWQERAQAAWAAAPAFPKPEYAAPLEALSRLRQARTPLLFSTADEHMLLRAHALASELGLPAVMRGSNYEYRRLDAVAKTGSPVLLPLDFPPPPAVSTPEAALEVTLSELRHWYLAPECARRLADAGMKVAFTGDGLKDRTEFLKAVRKTVLRGLAREQALASLTVIPAEILGLGQRYGTLDPGKSASFVVASGPLFDSETEVLETWVEGNRYVVTPQPRIEVRGTWSFDPDSASRLPDTLTLSIGGTRAAPVATLGRAPAVKLSRLEMVGTQFTFSLAGDSLGRPGITRLSATVDSAFMLGTGVAPDGTPFGWRASRQSDSVPKAPPDSGSGEGGADPLRDAGKRDSTLKLAPRFPDGDDGLTTLPVPEKLLALTHATIWTCGSQGVLQDATLVIANGKIVGVGTDLEPPGGARVVDASGTHITPGLIDCHSHTAIAGDVNEGTQTITAEVRIADVINPDDIGLYWELAGGLTTANLLHGSANAIGGQNQVIKLRWGLDAEHLKFDGAPPGIKFALGENPKQSNWGDRFTTRYPQTRMGVEQIIRDAFVAAREYRQRREAYLKKPQGEPVRQDLELDAVAEVIAGERLVHAHSYRQDEILMLMRLAEEFGFRVATFQHVLEGYKVADRLREHGAGASSFSDWWAYKFEVYDAIPHSGALMYAAGVLVSFNSDSGELARRLNTEAAKAVKYGGVPPVEALKFVTLNPAMQLGVEDRVGSLEPGKDADFVVWSGDPLSTYTQCRQTWIDGRLYFDRDRDRTMQEEQRAERAMLIQRVLESQEEPDGKQSRFGYRPGYSCGQHGGADE